MAGDRGVAGHLDLESGKVSDLTVAFRVMTPLMNSGLFWTLPSECP